MRTTTIVSVILLAVLAAPAVATFVAHAVVDMNDNNNITCTGNPHDKNDEGNPHEPPLWVGNPHFCPPITPRK